MENNLSKQNMNSQQKELYLLNSLANILISENKELSEDKLVRKVSTFFMRKKLRYDIEDSFRLRIKESIENDGVFINDFICSLQLSMKVCKDLKHYLRNLDMSRYTKQAQSELILRILE